VTPGERTPGLAAYGLTTWLAAPLADLWLRRRLAQGKEDPVRWREKLGHPGAPRPAGPLAWLHGASVGESLTLLPIAQTLRAGRPDVTVLITHGTRAAAELIAARKPAGSIAQFAPLDTPPAVRRFLAHWRPDLGVFVESELWPNLILAARARGARMALVSAALSAASLRGWRRAPGAARAVLGAFDLLLARDAAAARDLSSLGARVDGVANLKFGATPLPADLRAVAAMADALVGRPVILAASTHPGEDGLVLDAFRGAAAGGALLIIVPRHVERGAEIEALAREAGLAVARRSQGATPDGLEVYVADTLGELGLWYRLARLAVIGGSLVAGGAGGHNPLEPARLGCPFVAGPHVEAWPAYGDLARAGATRPAAPEDLAAIIAEAVAAPERLAPMAERAQAFVDAGDTAARGAIPRILGLLP
jgi:3-deoxy-D-manno-octulosonic-acid transferase